MNDLTVADTESESAETAANEDEHSDVVIEDLLVEDVSIDGMCGVY